MGDYRKGETEQTLLLDEDVKHLADLFPPRRVKTLSKVGLPKDAKDRAIVRMAWNRQFTIVTGNGQHFRKRIEEFQSRGVKDCSCLFGLVILPSGEAIQRHVLRDWKRLERELRYNDKRITWKDVHRDNYQVRVLKNGRAQVSQLPRCKTLHGEDSE